MTTTRHILAAAICAAAIACSDDDGPSFPPPPGDAPPTAQAGFDRTVGKNALVTLDATASFDPEGHPLTYIWTLVSRPGGSAATIANPVAPTTSFLTDATGSYVVRLQVSDGVNVAADEVVITSANQPPVANAGANREGSRGVPLSLSAHTSFDPDGDVLGFAWSLVSAPLGSSAALVNAATSTATLTPDAFGAYVVRLTVSDGLLTSQDDVTVTVVNHAPVANAGPDLEANAGTTLALSAAASTDPDQDSLTCVWTLVSRPDGSAAALGDAAGSCAPSVLLDAEGTYAFSLVVSDGSLQSAAADTVQVTVHKHVWMLGHLVTDAEYSRPLERVVSVGTSPNRLYVADPLTDTEQWVALSLVPTSVSVSPDGLYAAVGHNGFVSYVRLSPAPIAVEKVIATSADVFDVVLAGNGWIYAFPRIDQWVEIHCLRIDTGAETLSSSWSIRAGTRAKLHPGGAAIYGADNGLSPSDIEKYGIGSGTAAYLYDSPYHGDYAMCGDLWIAEDGLRIFTACANTFHSNTTQGTTAGSDMTYAGKLEGQTSVKWVDHSSAAGAVLAIPGNTWDSSTNDTALEVFGDDFLALQETVALPRIGVAGRGYAAHGRFAFFSADGTRRHVLVQVDASSGLLAPYAVVTY